MLLVTYWTYFQLVLNTKPYWFIVLCLHYIKVIALYECITQWGDRMQLHMPAAQEKGVRQWCSHQYCLKVAVKIAYFTGIYARVFPSFQEQQKNEQTLFSRLEWRWGVGVPSNLRSSCDYSFVVTFHTVNRAR